MQAYVYRDENHVQLILERNKPIFTKFSIHMNWGVILCLYKLITVRHQQKMF
jgi:hypothetical protein